MKRPAALLFPLAFSAATFAGMWMADRSVRVRDQHPDPDLGSKVRDARSADDGWREIPRLGSNREQALRAAAESGSRSAGAWLEAGEPPTPRTDGHPAGEDGSTARPSPLSTDDLIASLPPAQRKLARHYRRELDRLDPAGRRYLCWSSDTPKKVVEAFRRIEVEGGLAPGETRTQALQYDDPGGHWDRTATDGAGNRVQGLPITLTWSIALDGTTAPNLYSVGGPSDLRAWLTGIFGGSSSGDPELQPWFAPLEEAVRRIGEQNGVTLVYEPNDDGADLNAANAGILEVRGDIRLAARPLDGDNRTLSFAFSPDYGGDVVLDSSDGFFASANVDPAAMINVISHELGHSLGLQHVCPVNHTKLMEAQVTTAFAGPQFDDIYSLQRLYGDEWEAHAPERDNDSAGRATPILLDTGGATFGWLSIDDDSDVDYLRFTVPADRRITLRAIPSDPYGGTYLEGPETAACSGSPFDPRNRQDLTLEILDATGTSVLAEASAAGPAQTEEILDYDLPSGGDFLIRVGGGSNDTAQLYQLEAVIEAPMSYTLWSSGYPGLDPDPEVDDDGDGWPALAEYVLETDPLDPASRPQVATQLDATTLTLVLPLIPSRPDAGVVGETSIDLSGWTTTGVTAGAAGFSVPRADPQRFLRLRFTLQAP